jgi:hypothetical protein
LVAGPPPPLATHGEKRLSRGIGELLLVSVLCAVPHVVAGWSWYPAETRDALYYVFGASRVLAQGASAFVDPRAWSYSAFSPALALLAESTGVHPLTAFHWLGLAGAVLLPFSIGVFVYIVTRRWPPALLGSFVAGLWGGLAGYLWLIQSAVPALVRGDPGAAFLNTAYHEPRFLGEYAGHHGELVAYLADVPFYPREAGLVLFWPGLACIYSAADRGGLRALLAGSLLMLASAVVYPYYAVSAMLVLAAGIVLVAMRVAADRRVAFLGAGILILAVVAVATVMIADALVAGYSGLPGLRSYLSYLWRLAPKPETWLPPLVVSPLRTFGGHFFMFSVMALTLAAHRHDRRAWRIGVPWTGWPLFLVSLAATLAMGLLSWDAAVRRLLNAYGWIVPWRSLIEPVLLLGTALALERLSTMTSRAARVLLLLVPCLSPLHWAVNAGVYYGGGTGPERGRQLYARFTRYGEEALGRVHLREPLVSEAAAVAYVQAAFGVRAVPNRDRAGTDWLSPLHRPALLGLMRQGVFGDVLAARDSEFADSVLKSGDCALIGRAGPFVFLRARQAASR